MQIFPGQRLKHYRIIKTVKKLRPKVSFNFLLQHILHLLIVGLRCLFTETKKLQPLIQLFPAGSLATFSHPYIARTNYDITYRQISKTVALVFTYPPEPFTGIAAVLTEYLLVQCHNTAVNPDCGNNRLQNTARLEGVGKLADIAPTILTYLDMDIPPEMTGINRLVRKPEHAT